MYILVVALMRFRLFVRLFLYIGWSQTFFLYTSNTQMMDTPSGQPQWEGEGKVGSWCGENHPYLHYTSTPGDDGLEH